MSNPKIFSPQSNLGFLKNSISTSMFYYLKCSAKKGNSDNIHIININNIAKYIIVTGYNESIDFFKKKGIVKINIDTKNIILIKMTYLLYSSY